VYRESADDSYGERHCVGVGHDDGGECGGSQDCGKRAVGAAVSVDVVERACDCWANAAFVAGAIRAVAAAELGWDVCGGTAAGDWRKWGWGDDAAAEDSGDAGADVYGDGYGNVGDADACDDVDLGGAVMGGRERCERRFLPRRLGKVGAGS
jgi:hypothetical protein